MTWPRRAPLVASLLLVVAVGCTPSASPEPGSSGSGPSKCEVAFTAPRGFEATETFEDPYPDHVGIRLGFRDGEGRELHYFAGIPGEFGEGLPLDGTLAIVTGEQGRLLGEEDVWVLAWDTTGPCAPHAVLGSGFAREAFVRVLEESGVAASG